MPVYSGYANMGNFLENIFNNWFDITYGCPKFEVINDIFVESDGDYVTFTNEDLNISHSVDVRSFVLVVNQMMDDIVSKRINFIISKSRKEIVGDVRRLRSEWKRIK